ncbi:unnamed protein product [Closterium sp. NIES-54]
MALRVLVNLCPHKKYGFLYSQQIGFCYRMEFFRDASDATRGLNLLEFPRPFAGSTLVLPSVSVGNVGQLTVDLLLETLLQKQHQQKQQEQQQSQGGYSIARVGWLEELNVLPCAGNDPYSVGVRGARGMGLSAPGSLTTAMEVYHAVPKSQSTSPPFADAFTIIQQRSPVALGRMEEFSRNLATWAASQAFSRVVVLSGADAQRRLPPQIDGDQFRFLLVEPSQSLPASPSSPEPTQSALFNTSLLHSLGWQPLESCDPFGGLPSASSSLPTGADGSGTSTGERGNEGHMEPEQEEAVMAGEEGEEDPGPLRGGEWGPEQGLKWKVAFLRICIALREVSIPSIALLVFCSEGDNVPDAFHLAERLTALLPSSLLPSSAPPIAEPSGSVDGMHYDRPSVPSVHWCVPPSWGHLFGPPPDDALYC